MRAPIEGRVFTMYGDLNHPSSGCQSVIGARGGDRASSWSPSWPTCATVTWPLAVPVIQPGEDPHPGPLPGGEGEKPAPLPPGEGRGEGALGLGNAIM